MVGPFEGSFLRVMHSGPFEESFTRNAYGTDGGQFFLFTLKYIYLENSRGGQMPPLWAPMIE